MVNVNIDLHSRTLCDQSQWVIRFPWMRSVNFKTYFCVVNYFWSPFFVWQTSSLKVGMFIFVLIFLRIVHLKLSTMNSLLHCSLSVDRALVVLKSRLQIFRNVFNCSFQVGGACLVMSFPIEASSSSVNSQNLSCQYFFTLVLNKNNWIF
jgi:hypothetical protein